MIKTAIKRLAGAASMLLVLGIQIQTAAAGTDKVRAEAYFNAISGGNAETIASFYADNAEFHWVGGPLAGVYTGKAQIKGVWERFSKAAGDVDYKILEIAESQKGKRSTVTARVNFIGPTEVPVRFIMVYENGKIVNEIWEVDKPMVGYARSDPKPEAKPQAPSPAVSGQGEATPPEAAETEVPVRDEPVDTAANVPDEPVTQEPAVEANTVSPGDEGAAKAAESEGTPLPPVAKTAPPTPPKKAAAKPAQKKRYAQKEKKKGSQTYREHDDDGEDAYDGDADSDYVYYGRPYGFNRNYNRYGRGWYGGGYGGYGGY